ncbi:MAG TPA: PIN domain-containing protein [Acidobacteriaceae bacterium]
MKYLLDTDVVSQYKKLPPNPRVDAWMQRTDDREMYISEITYAELWYGIHLLPPGKRRTDLENWVEDDLYMQFFNRVVCVGLGVAKRYGSLMARAEKKGFSPSAMDAFIAAIALYNGMVVATLNRKGFEQLGVEIVEF